MGIDVTGIVKSAAVGLVGKNLRRVAGNVGNVLRGAGLGGDSSETAPLNRTKGAAVGGATKMLSFPLDVANADLNKGNHGHYILFEINVQEPNKLGFDKDREKTSVAAAINNVKNDDVKKNGKNHSNYLSNLRNQKQGISTPTGTTTTTPTVAAAPTVENDFLGDAVTAAANPDFNRGAGSYSSKSNPSHADLDFSAMSKLGASLSSARADFDYNDENAYDNPNSSVYIKRPATTKLDTVITMFMPSGIKTGYKAEYTDKTIGDGAKLASATYTDSINNQNLTSESVSDAVDNLQDNSGELAQVLSINLLLKGLAAVPVLAGAKEVAEMQAGQILSDRMELAFKGIGKREFVYEFKMMPRSAKEATEIVAIIAKFKNHMLPRMLGAAASGKRMSIPDTFDIKYMFGDKENSFLNKVSTCFLSDMQVSYGGGKFRTHDGGEPTETTISLTFKEIEIITRQRAEEGF